MINTIFKGVKTVSKSALFAFLGPSLSGEVAATSLHQAK